MFKATMVFQLATNVSSVDNPAKRVAGWTESHYTGNDLAETRVQLNQLCQLRAALLPNGAFIKGQRIQQVSPKGAAVTSSVRYPGSAGIQADVPQMALKVRIRAADTRNARNVELRGIPDARVVEGEYSGSQAFDAALATYLERLFFWRFKAIDLDQPIVPVVSISQGANNVGTVIFDDAPPADVGETLQIMDATNEDGDSVNGTFRVLTSLSDVRTATIANWRGGTVAEARARKYVVIYPGFAHNDPPQVPEVVTRKVGRPFGGYRGRASSRR
jgi:hypothetical protein